MGCRCKAWVVSVSVFMGGEKRLGDKAVVPQAAAELLCQAWEGMSNSGLAKKDILMVLSRAGKETVCLCRLMFWLIVVAMISF